jgi:hypothetical protein
LVGWLFVHLLAFLYVCLLATVEMFVVQIPILIVAETLREP